LGRVGDPKFISSPSSGHRLCENARFARLVGQLRRMEVEMKRIAVILAVLGAAATFAAPVGAAGNPFGVDFHANCTAGFAVSQTLGGEPGATELSQIAQPPKQFGNLSDVGFYSSTNCG
jgi:hypothetical protein